jgi:hypothetical protein
MIYEFDKEKCCPSTIHCNEIMNSQNNTPFEVPNSWMPFYKTMIDVQRLDKTDNDEVH